LTFLDLLGQIERHRSGGSEQEPSLIVVPCSLLDTWECETKLWCPHFRIFRYHATNGAERQILAEDFSQNYHGNCNMILTTAGMLQNKEDRKHFFLKVSFDYLICDEAHGVKNSGSARFRNLQRGVKAKRKLLITGTPVQNNMGELANLLTLLLDRPGDGVKHRKAVEELGEIVERGSLKTLQVRAAPLILRRLKRDVIKELPAKIGQTVRCDLSPEQRKLYDLELERAREETIRRGEKSRQRLDSAFVRSLFHRLRRICNHPLMGQSKYDEEDYRSLINALRQVRPDFQKAADQRAMQEVRSWSDFDVMQIVSEFGLLDFLGEQSSKFQASQEELLQGSAKIRRLVSLLEEQREAGRKTLVFSQFTQFLDVIQEALHRIGFCCGRLDGKVSLGDRPQVVKRFMTKDSGTDVFLLSTKAGGIGLNLTAADKVVLMDLSFNPHDNRQAEDRAHRLGQQLPVSVHYLVCTGTIEEVVLKVNLRKMELDYQFGGQKMLLGKEGSGGLVPAEDEDDEEPEGEENAEKLAEKDVLSELAAILK